MPVGSARLSCLLSEVRILVGRGIGHKWDICHHWAKRARRHSCSKSRSVPSSGGIRTHRARRPCGLQVRLMAFGDVRPCAAARSPRRSVRVGRPWTSAPIAPLLPHHVPRAGAAAISSRRSTMTRRAGSGGRGVGSGRPLDLTSCGRPAREAKARRSAFRPVRRGRSGRWPRCRRGRGAPSPPLTRPAAPRRCRPTRGSPCWRRGSRSARSTGSRVAAAGRRSNGR